MVVVWVARTASSLAAQKVDERGVLRAVPRAVMKVLRLAVHLAVL